MKRFLIPFLVLSVISCKEPSNKILTAQQIVDKSIENSGGSKYKDHNTTFKFRNKTYTSEVKDGQKILKRITFLDSARILDIRSNSGLQRFINDSLVELPDSIASRYANSVNSVHYFARLPFGLNDAAVHKKLLGEESIKDKTYFKVQVTFDQQGGGDDFDDTYIYWFDKETFKPMYLAYDFHVNGGGQRFREAYNERYVNGIRFVDYKNFKPTSKNSDILAIGKKFEKGELELLSKIELKEITVMEN